MRERLRDPIWQFAGTCTGIVAIIASLLTGWDSPCKWYILAILGIPLVLLVVSIVFPVSAMGSWVKSKIEALLSFFRSTWGRRIGGFMLLLGIVVLEYIRSQLPLTLWSIKLYLFFLQLFLLLGLVFQILAVKASTVGKLPVVSRFTVDATKETGINTGLLLKRGQQIRIVASGEVSINRGAPWMKPNGTMTRGAQVGEQLRATGTHLDENDGRGIVGALIGWIGEDRDKSSFFVGEGCTRKVDKSGPLYLGVNDSKGCYADNTDESGNPTFFTVYVEVLN